MSRNTCCGGCQDPVPNSLPDVERRTLPQGIIRYEAVGTSWVGTTDYSTGYSEGSRASLKCKKKNYNFAYFIQPAISLPSSRSTLYNWKKQQCLSAQWQKIQTSMWSSDVDCCYHHIQNSFLLSCLASTRHYYLAITCNMICKVILKYN